jgi:hypothetical protein
MTILDLPSAENLLETAASSTTTLVTEQRQGRFAHQQDVPNGIERWREGRIRILPFPTSRGHTIVAAWLAHRNPIHPPR